ncbi:hypothetical protein EX30DRAFT_349317 [Ascodesmis nigricans]|uniref:Autophagy-related protein 29 n=1 Tax=Ascodesmis nigricans TaxID=341454 RepID=A0A4S2MV43_9PEZI|nr:hypothetical protein EX30DRAFT_349317 [Ascodesmis nigricans]
MDPRRPSSRSIGAQQNYSQLPQRGGSLRGDRDGTRRGQAPPAPAQAPEPQYVVYLRLPFNRNGFVDPPQVCKSITILRDELAGQLQVPRAFLLQQAAWLYKRELNQIQAQMRRVGGISPGTLGTSSSPVTPTPNAFPPRPGTASGEGRPLSAFANRPVTGFMDTHPPSAVATPRPHTVLPGNPARAVSQLMSRGPSSQSHTSHPLSRFIPSQNPSPRPHPPSPRSSTDSTISSSSNDDEQTISTHGGVRKLPGFFTKKRLPSISSSHHYHHPSINNNPYNHDSSSSDNDDGVPAFLPFSATTETGSDLTGTITLPRRSGEWQSDREREREREPMSAITSASASVVSESATGSSGGEAGGGRGAGGTVRQHHHQNRRSVLSGVDSPNRSSAGPSSPSMGSSFSDLSDASVTQSAMEEAYLSTLHAGGMASRMSSLGQAMRSRYFTPQGGHDGGGQQ